MSNLLLKKILIVLSVILLLVIAVFGIYNLFFKDKAEKTEDKISGTPVSEYQPYSQGKMKAISEEPVLGAVIDNEKIRYYLSSSGHVFESNLDGLNKTPVSSADISGLLEVIWSPSKNQIILITQEGIKTKKTFYNYLSNKSAALSENMGWIAWSKTQDRIAYQYYNPNTEENNISIANGDGTNWKTIFQTRIKDLIVEWPSDDQIIIRTKPSGLAQSIAYNINPNTSDFKKIINETYGLTLLWSPLGNKFLYSETNSQGNSLKLKFADLTQNTTKDLEFTTLPEKCAWSQDNRTVFCAVPKIIPENSVMPDDYYKGKVRFKDTFWRYNLDTGESVQIFQADEDTENIYFDAKDLQLSRLEDYLIFINQRDGLLYSLTL